MKGIEECIVEKAYEGTVDGFISTSTLLGEDYHLPTFKLLEYLNVQDYLEPNIFLLAFDYGYRKTYLNTNFEKFKHLISYKQVDMLENIVIRVISSQFPSNVQELLYCVKMISMLKVDRPLNLLFPPCRNTCIEFFAICKRVQKFIHFQKQFTFPVVDTLNLTTGIRTKDCHFELTVNYFKHLNVLDSIQNNLPNFFTSEQLGANHTLVYNPILDRYFFWQRLSVGQKLDLDNVPIVSLGI